MNIPTVTHFWVKRGALPPEQVRFNRFHIAQITGGPVIPRGRLADEDVRLTREQALSLVNEFNRHAATWSPGFNLTYWV